ASVDLRQACVPQLDDRVVHSSPLSSVPESVPRALQLVNEGYRSELARMSARYATFADVRDVDAYYDAILGDMLPGLFASRWSLQPVRCAFEAAVRGIVARGLTMKITPNPLLLPIL